tara:strand:- start:45 stop:335 length:291 start_codon:yes stop_codon:yes gene_type:complete
MKSEYTVEELKTLLYKEQAEELDIPKQPTNIEFINEKYGKMPDSYMLKQKYPHKLLREHNAKGNLSDSDKFLLFLSPMLPFVVVWLVLFYIALYGI